MVDAAAKRNQCFVDAGVAQFMHAELGALDLGNKKFDKVLAMRVHLFHDQPDRATELAKRWLAPKGKLFAQYDQSRESVMNRSSIESSTPVAGHPVDALERVA